MRDRGIAFNVNLYFVRPNGDREQRQLVHFGVPSDHASTAHRSVTLFDDDTLRAADGSPRSTTLQNGSYFAPDIAPDGVVYNVIQVEVVVWRM